MLPVMEKSGKIFVCDHCGAVVQQGGAVVQQGGAVTLGMCPNCGVVRISGGKGYPVMPEAEQVATAVKRGNTKSERG